VIWKEDNMLPARTKVIMAIASGVGVAAGALTYLVSALSPRLCSPRAPQLGVPLTCFANSSAPTLDGLSATRTTARMMATTALSRIRLEDPRRQTDLLPTRGLRNVSETTTLMNALTWTFWRD
jgi:hypothetical protein